jgi:ribosomal protein L9
VKQASHIFPCGRPTHFVLTPDTNCKKEDKQQISSRKQLKNKLGKTKVVIFRKWGKSPNFYNSREGQPQRN